MNASKRTTVSALLLTLSCVVTACDPGYVEDEDGLAESDSAYEYEGEEAGELIGEIGEGDEDEAAIADYEGEDDAVEHSEVEREIEREIERENDNCTYTLRHWRVYNAYAGAEAFKQDWPLSEDTQLCGWTWLDIVDTPADGDVWSELAQPLIASILNVEKGAWMPADIHDAIVKSKGLVSLCDIDEQSRKQALELAEMLHDYNDGRVGPGSCY